MYSFFWRLYEQTGDPAYVQVLYRENGKKLNGLPHDLFADDPAAFRSQVDKVIMQEGDELKLGSINKEAWHLAILRSGRGQTKRAVWLDYDAGGGHSHIDGLTLGLFAHGLDLLPDFGYPPVQFGGWETPKAHWYSSTLAHNTVSVDNRNQSGGAGTITLWADGETFHAVRASAPQLFGVQQYERTAALIDVSDSQSYVLDIFRVTGGANHTKFVYGPFGQVTHSGLSLLPAAKPVPGAILRNLQSDPKPEPGWSVTWNVDDHYHALPPNAKIGLRYTDLSTGVEAVAAEAWIAPMQSFSLETKEAWIPCSITRKTGPAPLSSTFVSVLEPFEKKSAIKNIKRLPLPDDHVAIEVELANGNRDLILASGCTNADWQIEFSGDLCWLRRNKAGQTTRLALAKSSSFHDSSVSVQSTRNADFVELDLSGKQPHVLRGDASAWQIKVTR